MVAVEHEAEPSRHTAGARRPGIGRTLAQAWPQERTLIVLDHLADTRQALERNVAPLLALESFLVTVTSGRTP